MISRTAEVLRSSSDFLDEMNKDLLDASLIRNAVRVNNLLESCARAEFFCPIRDCECKSIDKESLGLTAYCFSITDANVEAALYSASVRGHFEVKGPMLFKTEVLQAYREARGQNANI